MAPLFTHQPHGDRHQLDTPWRTVGEFLEWLRSLGGLRTFWTKRIISASVEDTSPLRVLVEWSARRGPRRATIVVALSPQDLEASIDPRGLPAPTATTIAHIVITPFELPRQLYDRRSIVFFYETGGTIPLEPNREVRVEIYEYREVSPETLEHVRRVQEQSWGFYIPPLEGDVVFLARLGGRAVGAAYYNPRSSNIDYGVHVVPDMWRRRVGARILGELLEYARSHNAKWVTVVRVLRGSRGGPSSQDRRAIAFYQALNPRIVLNVYRLVLPRAV